MIHYFNQDGCHNCKHVFVRTEHDEERQYFCCLGAKKRPRCMSVAMGEFDRGFGKKHDSAHYKWDKWSEGKEVMAFGICSEFVLNPKIFVPKADCQLGEKWI